jgi:hypothetical protein
MRKGAFQEAEGCGKISRALVGAGGMNRLHRPFLENNPPADRDYKKERKAQWNSKR